MTLTPEQREAVELLRIIFPMARAYAFEHPVGKNKEMVAEAESYLAQADAPAPLPADAAEQQNGKVHMSNVTDDPSSAPADSKSRVRCGYCDKMIDPVSAGRLYAAAPAERPPTEAPTDWNAMSSREKTALMNGAVNRMLDGVKGMPPDARADYLSLCSTVCISVMHGTYGRQFASDYLNAALQSLDEPLIRHLVNVLTWFVNATGARAAV